jgi:tRNA pseudouridine32 synthase/23S rRNA pseudouridine746 synthase
LQRFTRLLTPVAQPVPIPAFPAPPAPSRLPPPARTAQEDIGILHADAALLVVLKPAGMLSVPGRGEERADCVATRVQARYPDALVVHRLDMATSGLMLFGLGLAAQRTLSRSFERREVSKRYLAVVDKLVLQDEGSVTSPLICDWPNRPRQRVDELRGKPALTHWRVLERDVAQNCSRVELQPVTGRSHQLRVHLQSIGHPILGDELYASPEAFARSPRLLLHACQIGLPHPASGAWMAFEDPAPF